MSKAEQLSLLGSDVPVESASRAPARMNNTADRAFLTALEQALSRARALSDGRPPLLVLAGLLDRSPASMPRSAPSLLAARDDWLRRLRTSCRSESALTAYRVAIDDLLAWATEHDRSVFTEQAIVDYLATYQAAKRPAPATYYRRFLLLRRFLRWVSRRDGVPDPFLDLEAPPKPRQERDWLTREEFARLVEAAGKPERNLAGLAERDTLALRLLVTTGLRRSELCALTWRDVELDGSPTLLVRRGKGGKPRRQPIPPGLADELRSLRTQRDPGDDDPVVCGLAGGRLQQTILAEIIRRAAKRANIEKHVTAHTLRHTAATWLRQELGDTRLVAEYLGHADLSTIARYAHVDRSELVTAAGRLEVLTRHVPEPTESTARAVAAQTRDKGEHRRARRKRRRRSGR